MQYFEFGLSAKCLAFKDMHSSPKKTTSDLRMSTHMIAIFISYKLISLKQFKGVKISTLYDPSLCRKFFVYKAFIEK